MISEFERNGVKVETAPRKKIIGSISQQKICLIGTATTKHEDIQYNQPFLMGADDLSKIEGGTLEPSLQFIFAQMHTEVYVIVVEGSDVQTAITNISEHKEAFLQCAIAPTIILAPQVHDVATTKELAVIAERIKAILFVDSSNTNIDDATVFVDSLGVSESKVVVCEPSGFYKDVEIPASTRGAVAYAKVKPWQSPQGQSDLCLRNKREIGYAASDDLSEHNKLNKLGVLTFAKTRAGGYSAIGNRCVKGEFIPHVGLDNALSRKLEEVSEEFLGQNITESLLSYILSTINSWLRNLAADNSLLEAKAVKSDSNTPEGLANGELQIDIQYSKFSPLENLTFKLSLREDV